MTVEEGAEDPETTDEALVKGLGSDLGPADEGATGGTTLVVCFASAGSELAETTTGAALEAPAATGAPMWLELCPDETPLLLPQLSLLLPLISPPLLLLLLESSPTLPMLGLLVALGESLEEFSPEVGDVPTPDDEIASED